MISTLILTTLLGSQPTLTVKVEGDGFMRFAKGPMMIYTRHAKLSPSPDGLATADGSVLVPRIVVPTGTSALTVSLDGTINAQLSTGSKPLGRMVLALFPQKTKLEAFGNFVRTTAKPTLANPGEGIAGVVRLTSGEAQVAAKTPAISGTAAQPFVALKAEIRVNLKSEVEEEYIKLGSIAEIEASPQLTQKLKSIELGRSPIFGSTRGLTLMNIKATLLAAKIDIREIDLVVPSGAMVERKCQKVDSETITLAVQDAVKKKLGFETQLELKNRLQTLCVPMGTLMLDVAQVQFNNGTILAAVDVTVASKLVSSLSLSYSVPGLAQVKRGEVVRLRMISNSAKVEVSAKAKSEAYLGQKITVETGTGALQTGTLIGPSLVEVRL